MASNTRNEKRVLYLFNAVLDLERKIRQFNGLALTTVFAGSVVIGISVGGLGWMLAAMVGGAGAYRILPAWAHFHNNSRRRE
jgi:hypothetical protein